MNSLDEKLKELRDYVPECPDNLRNRCLSTIPERPSRRPRAFTIAYACAAVIAVAALIVLPMHRRGQQAELGAPAYADVLKAIDDAPYFHGRYYSAELPEQPAFELWYDNERGSVARYLIPDPSKLPYSLGNNYASLLDLPSGDLWLIGSGKQGGLGKVFHQPLSTWKLKPGEDNWNDYSQVIRDPYPMPLSHNVTKSDRVRISKGQWQGKSVTKMTVDFAPVNAPGPNRRTVIFIDPATNRPLAEQWFDKQWDGYYQITGWLVMDFSRADPSVFDQYTYLKPGYKRTDYWVDEKRHLLLSKNGKIVGHIRNGSYDLDQ